jgi:mono/diheme cytochrome c family protein
MYLAEHVTGCIDCHSTRNWKYYAGPVVAGSEGKGGQVFGQEVGIPGALVAPNITPAGIGSMTDGELYRALTSGIGKNGQALFPLMPYLNYTKMSEEDIYSIIAYVRTLKPIEHATPASRLDFPLNYIVRTIPTRHEPQPGPDTSTMYSYGKYLVEIAGCADCHTPFEQGKPKLGMGFAGGREFDLPTGTVRSANITPDEETGIGSWTADIFVAKFKQYATEEGKTLSPESMNAQTVMPWTLLAGMTERDLLAIYTYLHTIPPVRREVVHYSPK